jgi:rare lipoprotein A
MHNRLYGNNPVTTILLFLMLCSILLLNGCSTTHTKDGPPPFPVDETKIPNAVPKKEPLSKYGNLDTYRVFGKRYYTLKSSQGYEAQGTASWYGTKFHRVRTSSGERYNMLGMTAAHKTLPLPTYVQVTNLANNKKVIVKVNDRGPFEGDRLIDLSYVAAKKLGMLGHGTAFVDVKAIDPDEYRRQILTDKPTIFAHNQTHPKMIHNNAGVYLQVGAFKNRVYAERLQSRLTHYLSSPVQITNKTSGHLYHVQIGPIKDVATAQQITRRLQSIGVKGTHKVKSQMEA